EDLAQSRLGELRGQLAAALADADWQPAWFGRDGRPVVLHVLHGWGGGAERFVRDLAASDTARRHLVLRAFGDFTRRRYGEVLELHDGSLRGPALRRLPLTAPIADTVLHHHDWQRFFDETLAHYAVDAVLVSSLIGHSLDALRSGRPTVVVAHDCYPLWPLLHRDFGDASLAFDAAQRAADLAAADSEFEFAQRDPGYWQQLRDAYVAALLAAEVRLAAPSRTALANVLRLAPELASLPARVIAHGIAPLTPADARAPRDGARLRLVVPGRVRRGKGAELLAAVLPLLPPQVELVLLGAGAEGHEFFGHAGVHVVLNYAREELPQLIAALQPDAALLLPTVAETFSYTLSECWSLGLPVIATRVGALAERISDGVDGFLVEPEAAAVAARIADLSAQREPLLRARAALRSHAPRSLAAMSADYAAELPAAPAAPALPPQAATTTQIELTAVRGELDALRTQLRRQTATLRQQQHELDARAEWASELDRELRRSQRDVGIALAEIERAQDDLVQRTEWLTRTQDDYVELEREFDERTRWALALKAELDRAYASLSWRLTKPLRFGMRKLRGLRARLAFSATRTRGIWQRLRGSLRRRGLAGTV
ncbi:glycosyltransferase, partial [Tahibacter caeni]|uniref:glycosyltransferase n=1 Tax=Tahibacter caeni TaxID=1453545 RepID=UPI002148B233